jgi:hypothetical protein
MDRDQHLHTGKMTSRLLTRIIDGFVAVEMALKLVGSSLVTGLAAHAIRQVGDTMSEFHRIFFIYLATIPPLTMLVTLLWTAAYILQTTYILPQVDRRIFRNWIVDPAFALVWLVGVAFMTHLSKAECGVLFDWIYIIPRDPDSCGTRRAELACCFLLTIFYTVSSLFNFLIDRSAGDDRTQMFYLRPMWAMDEKEPFDASLKVECGNGHTHTPTPTMNSDSQTVVVVGEGEEEGDEVFQVDDGELDEAYDEDEGRDHDHDQVSEADSWEDPPPMYGEGEEEE